MSSWALQCEKWANRVEELVRDRKANRLTPQQFLEEVESHVEETPTTPIVAHSLFRIDLEEIFHIYRTDEKPSWTTPTQRIQFLDCFCETCSLN